MSTSSLIIGRSALQASQLALQVTGNNIANAATPGYSRQRVELIPTPGTDVQQGVFIGRGVGVDEVGRLVDPALKARVRSASADEAAAAVAADIYDSLESVTNELSNNDISSRLEEFFNAFSELANNPAASVGRAAVIETAGRLAGQVRAVHADMLELRAQVDDNMSTSVLEVNSILERIVSLNNKIVATEAGAGENPALRDQRDSLLDELSTQLDISTVELESGAINVFVGSEPIIDGSKIRELAFVQEMDPVTNDLLTEIRLQEDDTLLNISGGRLGGLIEQRQDALQSNIDDLDAFAVELIFTINAIHAQGRPDARLTSVASERSIDVADQTVALNDPANTSFADLPFAISHGSFPLVVTDSNGDRVIEPININLDGITAGGAAGFADDTSLDDIVTQINAASANVTASITATGQLSIVADPGYDVAFAYLADTPDSFGNRLVADTSGVLAALGINNLLTGTGAGDLNINQDLVQNPELLSLGADEGSNETALALAALRDTPIQAFSGVSLGERWQQQVERNAVNTAGAAARFDALSAVRENLSAQEQGISGVSLDEETINLINYQQQYTGAARFISVVDELTQVLFGLV